MTDQSKIGQDLDEWLADVEPLRKLSPDERIASFITAADRFGKAFLDFGVSLAEAVRATNRLAEAFRKVDLYRYEQSKARSQWWAKHRTQPWGKQARKRR